jgi:hypothetical protein
VGDTLFGAAWQEELPTMVSCLFTRRTKELATILVASTLACVACGARTDLGATSGADMPSVESSSSPTSSVKSSATSTSAGRTSASSATSGTGACLLSYNTAPLILSNGALSNPGGCCLYAGGRDQCDTKATCGSAAGAGCCLIYTTPAAGFSACCQYEFNINPPTDPGCSALLKMGR